MSNELTEREDHHSMILIRNSNNCPSTRVYHDESYVAEVYALTALGVIVFMARYTVRLRVLPWRKLQGDDWTGHRGAGILHRIDKRQIDSIPPWRQFRFHRGCYQETE